MPGSKKYASNLDSSAAHFAEVSLYQTDDELRSMRDSRWNRSYSTFDLIVQKRPKARFLDCADPKVAIEAFRNVADTKLAQTCAWAPNRVNKELAASVDRFRKTCDGFNKHNQLDSLVYREGSRIQHHINPSGIRLMNMDHPCLQGKWNQDWAPHGSIALLKKSRGRMEKYAKDRDQRWAQLEIDRVMQLQREQMGEKDMIARLEQSNGNIPPLAVYREGLFQANSRLRYPTGLARASTAPINGPGVMRSAAQGLSYNASAYRGGKGVTGC